MITECELSTPTFRQIGAHWRILLGELPGCKGDTVPCQVSIEAQPDASNLIIHVPPVKLGLDAIEWSQSLDEVTDSGLAMTALRRRYPKETDRRVRTAWLEIELCTKGPEKHCESQVVATDTEYLEAFQEGCPSDQ